MAVAKKKPGNVTVKPMPVGKPVPVGGRGSAGRKPEWRGAVAGPKAPVTPQAKNLTPPSTTGIKKNPKKKSTSSIYW